MVPPRSPDLSLPALDIRPPGVDRRSFLRVAANAGLLWGLGGGVAEAGTRTRTPLVLLFLSGGVDKKSSVEPDPLMLRNGTRVPADYRGPFGSIRARNGTEFSELFPRFADKSDRVALVRSLFVNSSAFLDHEQISRAILLAQGAPFPLTVGTRMSSPNAAPYMLLNPGSSFPSLDGAFGKSNALVPAWDRDRAVFQNPFAPQLIANATPNPQETVEGLEEEEAVPVTPPEVVETRRSLLGLLATHSRLDTPQTRRMEQFQETAFRLSRGDGPFFEALRLEEQNRDRYGRSIAGVMSQTAVQLVRSGAGAVAIYYEPDFSTFDLHQGLQDGMRRHGPPVDHAIGALIDDAERGLFTLAVMTEFNRTPRMNDRAGRDHHPKGNWAMLAGPNVRKGAVIGSSDYRGEIADHPINQSPALPHTVLAACGLPAAPGQPMIPEMLR